MKALASLLGDGHGNLSTMRFVGIVTVLALVVAKFYNAHLTSQPVTFTTADVELLGVVVGGKVLQNIQEKSNEPEKPTV